ncbi:hypothetical protein B0H14DRAFT_3438025 [Mycena olivaceomarginata]|nr:hypothetical protein B0H14DRAFT_3438025 [Mycena olivaceomarginata]
MPRATTSPGAPLEAYRAFFDHLDSKGVSAVFLIFLSLFSFRVDYGLGPFPILSLFRRQPSLPFSPLAPPLLLLLLLLSLLRHLPPPSSPSLPPPLCPSPLAPPSSSFVPPYPPMLLRCPRLPGLRSRFTPPLVSRPPSLPRPPMPSLLGCADDSRARALIVPRTLRVRADISIGLRLETGTHTRSDSGPEHRGGDDGGGQGGLEQTD